MLNLILSGLVVLVTHALEAITGFGCTVIAVPFVTALLGMKQGIMIVTILAWLLALYIVLTNLKHVKIKHTLLILALMIPTLPFGMYIFRYVDPSLFKKGLSIFIILVSVLNLYKLINTKNSNTNDEIQLSRLDKIKSVLALLVGGIVHGAISSGGPLVVIYATKVLKDKKEFRATLCSVWLTLNTIIIVSYFFNNSGFTFETFTNTLTQLPFLLAGIIVGEVVHNKVNSRTFSIIVFSLLFLTGIFMFAL